MRFNGPLLVAWVLRPWALDVMFMVCFKSCRLASAFYHGGVSWLIPNLTVGSVDEEAWIAVSTRQFPSGCVAMQDGSEFWYSSCISFCLVVALHSADAPRNCFWRTLIP